MNYYLVNMFTHFGASCGGGGFLAFPTWYKYLPLDANCAPQLQSLSDIWLIGAAIIEILLRVAVLGAIGVVIWGGIKMTTSQGDAGGVAAARNTIMDGLVGLVISIVATGVINFVAGRF